MVDSSDYELWGMDALAAGGEAQEAPPFSIVVPLREEAERAGKVLARLGRFLEAARWDAEVVVVDDGSKDGTAEACSRWRRSLENMTVVRHGRRHGRGMAARTGVLLATGSCVIVVDSRGDTPPEDATVLVDSLRRGADLALSSRRLPGSEVQGSESFLDRASATTFTAISKMLVPVAVRDTTTELIAMRRKTARRVAQRARTSSDAFAHEWLALADRLGERVIEIPVSCLDENEDGARRRLNELIMLRDVWRMRRRLGGDAAPAPEAAHQLLRETSFTRVERKTPGGWRR